MAPAHLPMPGQPLARYVGSVLVVAIAWCAGAVGQDLVSGDASPGGASAALGVGFGVGMSAVLCWVAGDAVRRRRLSSRGARGQGKATGWLADLEARTQVDAVTTPADIAAEVPADDPAGASIEAPAATPVGPPAEVPAEVPVTTPTRPRPARERPAEVHGGAPDRPRAELPRRGVGGTVLAPAPPVAEPIAAPEDDEEERILVDGLPPLPEDLEPEDYAYVARWVGPRFAGLRYLARYVFDGEEYVDDNVQLFHRDGAGWEEASSDGGTNWLWDEPPLLRRPLEDDGQFSLHLLHVGRGSDWVGALLWGEVGPDARLIELEDDDGIHPMPVESPLGLVVVAADGTRPFEVRVLDGRGELLGRQSYRPDGPLQVRTANVQGRRLPARVFAALRLVEADCRRTLDTRVTLDAGHDEHGFVRLWVQFADGTRVLTFDPDQPAFSALVTDIARRTLAEGALHEGVQEPWPACPAHRRHTMRPQALDDGAWWCCPDDGRQVRVGELT
jgi:hypothetical protein